MRIKEILLISIALLTLLSCCRTYRAIESPSATQEDSGNCLLEAPDSLIVDVITIDSVNLTWGAANNTSTYKLKLTRISNQNIILDTILSSQVLSFGIGNLLPEKYEAEVRSICSNGDVSSYSITTSILILDLIALTEPTDTLTGLHDCLCEPSPLNAISENPIIIEQPASGRRAIYLIEVEFDDSHSFQFKIGIDHHCNEIKMRIADCLTSDSVSISTIHDTNTTISLELNFGELPDAAVVIRPIPTGARDDENRQIEITATGRSITDISLSRCQKQSGGSTWTTGCSP